MYGYTYICIYAYMYIYICIYVYNESCLARPLMSSMSKDIAKLERHRPNPTRMQTNYAVIRCVIVVVLVVVSSLLKDNTTCNVVDCTNRCDHMRPNPTIACAHQCETQSYIVSFNNFFFNWLAATLFSFLASICLITSPTTPIAVFPTFAACFSVTVAHRSRPLAFDAK